MNDSGQSAPITRQYFYQALHCLRSGVRRLPPAPPGVDFDLLRNMMLAHDRAVISRRDAQATGSVATETQSPAPGLGLPAHISQPVNILWVPYVVSQSDVSTSGLFAPTGSTRASPINIQTLRPPPLPQMKALLPSRGDHHLDPSMRPRLRYPHTSDTFVGQPINTHSHSPTLRDLDIPVLGPQWPHNPQGIDQLGNQEELRFVPNISTSPAHFPLPLQSIYPGGNRPAITNEGGSYLSHTLSHDSSLSWRETRHKNDDILSRTHRSSNITVPPPWQLSSSDSRVTTNVAPTSSLQTEVCSYGSAVVESTTDHIVHALGSNADLRQQAGQPGMEARSLHITPSISNESTARLLTEDTVLQASRTDTIGTQNQLGRQSGIRPSCRTPGGMCCDFRAMPTTSQTPTHGPTLSRDHQRVQPCAPAKGVDFERISRNQWPNNTATTPLAGQTSSRLPRSPNRSNVVNIPHAHVKFQVPLDPTSTSFPDMVHPNRNRPALILRPSVARDVLLALGRRDILIALNDAQITPLPSGCFEVPHQPTTTTTATSLTTHPILSPHDPPKTPHVVSVMPIRADERSTSSLALVHDDRKISGTVQPTTNKREDVTACLRPKRKRSPTMEEHASLPHTPSRPASTCADTLSPPRSDARIALGPNTALITTEEFDVIGGPGTRESC